MSDAEQPTNEKPKAKSRAVAKPRRWCSHPRVRKEIIDVLAGGGSRAEAAMRAGCGPSAIAAECRHDDKFAKQVWDAEVGGKFALVNQILVAARGSEGKPGDWRAAAWLLERKHWKEFGKRSPDQVSPEQLVAVISRLVTAILADVPEEHRNKARANVDLVLGTLTNGAFIEASLTVHGKPTEKPDA